MTSIPRTTLVARLCHAVIRDMMASRLSSVAEACAVALEYSQTGGCYNANDISPDWLSFSQQLGRG
jgi:hypothetical protein